MAHILDIEQQAMIIRRLEGVINSRLFTGKAIVLLGPRQTGKTTLIHNIIRNVQDVLVLTGDDSDTATLLSLANTEVMQSIIGQNKIVFIDEAQQIEKIGRTAKIIVDHFKGVQLILSGSSSLGLRNVLAHSLAGRKWEYLMYPVVWSELEQTYGYFKSRQQLERRVIYGMYPDIITHVTEERERLKQLVNSYLYKKPDIFEELLKVLALKMCKELSIRDVSKSLHADKNTLNNCIETLEKDLIIFTQESQSKLKRNKWRSFKRVFFWDNGIRNAILSNFNPLSKRKDEDDLWENFQTSDNMKKNNWIKPNIIQL
ncbi:MAG: AAA family ATPase [Bacteroidales bacterium]|nr:AAA family ATPase [Bacteroidales bacterium]